MLHKSLVFLLLQGLRVVDWYQRWVLGLLSRSLVENIRRVSWRRDLEGGTVAAIFVYTRGWTGPQDGLLYQTGGLVQDILLRSSLPLEDTVTLNNR